MTARVGDARGWLRRVLRPGAALKVPEAEPLVREHRRHHPGGDADAVRRAYRVAAALHEGQVRKSGDPYVTHPLAVATRLAEMGMDSATVVAALLHDTVEDTDYTLGEVAAYFGDEVAVLVDGVTKLEGSRWGDRAESETFRKMILATASDLRVMVIKLADRLHNLQTLQFHPKREKRERIARQSMELLVPFAERLGVHVLKREMEDLAFEVLQPERYRAVRDAVGAVRDEHAEILRNVAGRAEEALRGAGLDADVRVRARHLYSVYRDRRRLDDLRPGDTHRVIAVVDGPDGDCYVALGVLHGLWRPLPGRFTDHIAAPKYNLYKSLHTQVLDDEGRALDLFVRTAAQHRVSEFGLVAHVADAASDADRARVTRRSDLEWLRRLLAWQSQTGSGDFIDSLRLDLQPGGVVTFTGDGRAIVLPEGATPIDFAYALGPETGNHCVGASVDGRLTPLSSALHDGNVVEPITSPDGHPEPGWRDVAASAAARVQIDRWLSERRAEKAAAAGRVLLGEQLALLAVGILHAETSGAAISVARARGHRDLEAMYAALAAGTYRPDELAAAVAEITPADR